MIIVGAGLAGLLAAHAWPQAAIVERAPGPEQLHHALLRFRSDAVARLTGMEFKPVMVRKGIWQNGQFVQPDICVANNYSRKTQNNNIEGERSIWSIEPASRWIAPETFYEQLIENVRTRVMWNNPFDYKRSAIITAPLPLSLAALEIPFDGVQFNKAPIFVIRYRVPRCNVYQTVYFPSLAHTAYRASITGSLLIIEHAGEQPQGDWATEVERAFSIKDAEPISTMRQSYGKIADIDNVARKDLIYQLTVKGKLYSLGRFATWRNILLDDVVRDIDVIKRLARSSSYDHYKAANS